jgi:hypothetical protein
VQQKLKSKNLQKTTKKRETLPINRDYQTPIKSALDSDTRKTKHVLGHFHAFWKDVKDRHASFAALCM